MFGFHTCVYLFGTKTVKDTQCGFKLLTRNVKQLMPKLYSILLLLLVNNVNG